MKRDFGTMAQCRRAAGLTQRQAAASLSISLRSYQRLEHGEHGIHNPMGLRRELAELFSALLGQRISGQWDLGPTGPTERRTTRNRRPR